MNSERKTQEFWYARELQEVLDYSQWRRFKDVIEKAMDSCEASGNMVEDHFANVGKMVSIGSSAEHAGKTAPANWPGQNLLGRILMELRDELS